MVNMGDGGYDTHTTCCGLIALQTYVQCVLKSSLCKIKLYSDCSEVHGLGIGSVLFPSRILISDFARGSTPK